MTLNYFLYLLDNYYMLPVIFILFLAGAYNIMRNVKREYVMSAVMFGLFVWAVIIYVIGKGL